ncbi:MAG TPA: cyclic nucleotide-binding domain-containing protein [Kofleriaceae bacterium]|jgi:CRP-like cAMP-binding protein|nr:cyclic nucleotide-binding domain-containing protein [Kofleriaceae bacterium]
MSEVSEVSEASEASDVELLRQVDFLAMLDDATLAELLDRGTLVKRPSGARLISELESGADMFVVMRGTAEVFVEPRRGQRRVLGTLGPGHAFGEMSSVTGALRSATVMATSDIEVLEVDDALFDQLRARRPEIAVALLATLARRLADADRQIDALLSQHDAPALPAAPEERGSIRRVWRELVVERKRDLTFATLAAFVLTLIAVRLAVYLSFRLDVAPRGVLRAAYMTGFGLLVISAATSVLTFRPAIRKLVAIAYGIGAALIFNELGVTLAFDIFFKDIHTPDPDVAFDIERLYRRTAPLRAIVIGLVVLIQIVYLRHFYRRVWFILRTRLRRRKM